MNNLHIIICILFTIISNRKVISEAKLPHKLHRCKVTGSYDYRPNRCLKEAVQHAILYLSDGGDPKLGLPDLDPLRVNEIAIKPGSTDGPVGIELVFKNIDLHGISNYKLKSFEGNVSSPKEFRINIDGVIDSLQLIGGYSMNGKVLLFPVRGAGACNVTLEGIRAGVKMTGEPLMKGDKEFVKIKDFKMSIELDRAYLHFENLFKDKGIADAMNVFMTENWSEVYAELRPAIEKPIGQLFEVYTKRILERIPYEDIFVLD